MNNQPTEKITFVESGALEVFKIFPTIQGEGPFAGQRAIFVRLAGCNLQCPLCDTDYTSNRIVVNPKDLVKLVSVHDMPRALVVITGGEPFRQNLDPSVRALLYAGFRVQIETNGTLYQELHYGLITIVCSPKTGTVNKKLFRHINAYKYVVNGELAEDGLPLKALEHSASPRLARPHQGFRGSIYLQPADESDEQKYQENLHRCIDSVVKHGYTLGLQIHKIINME